LDPEGSESGKLFSKSRFNQKMKKILSIFALAAIAAFCSTSAAFAQASGDAPFTPSGKFSMQFFGDYDYMLNADTLAGKTSSLAGKGYYSPNSGAVNTPGTKDFSQFDIRRVYLGYNYDFSKDVSAQLLFSHETGALVSTAAAVTSVTSTTDSTKHVTSVTTKTSTFLTSPAGDILLDGNRSIYLKAANVQFKNWWMNSAVIFGQQSTPAFGVSENLFGYRSIEKSIADMRGFAQSNDLGITAKGSLDQPGLYNYAVMISNGNGAKPDNTKDKKLSVELNGWFLDKKIVVEAYMDLMGKPTVAGPTTTIVGTDTTKASNYDQSTMTLKFLAGYMSDPITIGVEYVMQTLTGQSTITAGGDATPNGLSVFARGTILQKQLMWFARYDMFDPDSKATGSNVLNTLPVSWKESFITAGIDWQPDMASNAHVIPNIWIDNYSDKSSAALGRQGIMVGRVTFAYKF
jgi:hypothetical protein